MKNKSIFPFESVDIIEEGSSYTNSFIKTVESVLLQDLQSRRRFGCKIVDSHTHAGSKIHFRNFIEAELLFHNNYYNRGFAQLTFFHILKEIRGYHRKPIKHIILVGYESYSELYLNEVKNLFEKEYGKDTKDYIRCDYCIHETHVRIENKKNRIYETVIRNALPKRKKEEQDENVQFYISYNLKNEKYTTEVKLNNETLLVFIVPINTTLSSMDKLISKFYDTIGLENNNRNNMTKASLLLSLITIGPENGDEIETWYWKKEGNKLIPKHERFVELSTFNEKNVIENFAYVASKWMYCHSKIINSKFTWCEDCFPDYNNKKIEDEKPIFDVPKGSVIPMLQLEQRSFLAPSDNPNKDLSIIKNLKKVWDISEYMTYRHIEKEGNHFQYFFDRVGFLNAYKENIIADLKSAKKELFGDEKPDGFIFNYIVSPRQNGNAQWVNLVCKNIFEPEEESRALDNLRTLYFEINREYRSNLKAKYSDFFHTIENICQTEEKSEIRFHFVDETIVTGGTFIRAVDLIQCLLSEVDRKFLKKISISLFHTVILIYGRASEDTRKFLLNYFKFNNNSLKDKEINLKLFYEYLHIHIPSIRTHEDACILCKFVNDYRKIEKTCVTNRLASSCKEVIKEHDLQHIHNLSLKEGIWRFDEYSFQVNLEKRFMLLISDLLNIRLGKNNHSIFDEEKINTQIDIAGSEGVIEIQAILEDYYDNGITWLKKEVLSENDDLITEDEERKKLFNDDEDYFHIMYKIAFIKVISRPFFSFHLRKKQAAFSFILKKLSQFIKEDILLLSGSTRWLLFNALFNAMVDYNANYIFRIVEEGGSPLLKLLQLAEMSDEIENQQFEERAEIDNNIKSEIFSSGKLIQGIKKLSVLSQDNTKTLLLETNLLYENEDYFFKKDCEISNDKVQYFLKDLSERTILTTRAILYLENTSILTYALEELNNRNDISEKITNAYFLDNFFELCKLNGVSKQEIQLQALADTYLRLREKIKSYHEADDYQIDELMLEWLNTFYKIDNPQFKIITFLKDSEEDSPVEFYLMKNILKRENDEVVTWFYSDKTRIVLSKLISFMADEDIQYYKDDKNSLLVFKFTRKTSKENHNSNSETTSKERTIYGVIRGFDPKSVRNWFFLKLILIFRKNFIKLIKKINLKMVLSKKKQEFIKEALSIEKALAHGDTKEKTILTFSEKKSNGYFYNTALKGMMEEIKNGKDIEQILLRIYFHYLYIQTDNHIAELYRKALGVGTHTRLGWNLFPIPIYKEEDDKSYFLENFLDVFSIDSEYEFDYFYIKDDENKSFNKAKVSFFILQSGEQSKDMTKCKHYFFNYYKVDSGFDLHNSLVYLVVTFIHNMIKHSKLDADEMKMEVILDLDRRKMIFKNKVNSSKLMDGNQKLVLDELNERLLRKQSIFPYFTENKSITLWTLKHIPFKEKNEDWILFKYIEERGEIYFQVELSNIKEKGEFANEQ